MHSTRLTDLTADLLAQAREKPSRRVASMVTGGAGTLLRQIVLALCAGAELSEHENPGEASLQVLDGDVRLTSGASDLELAAGDLATIPQARHSLYAISDAVVLLTVVRT